MWLKLITYVERRTLMKHEFKVKAVYNGVLTTSFMLNKNLERDFFVELGVIHIPTKIYMHAD